MQDKSTQEFLNQEKQAMNHLSQPLTASTLSQRLQCSEKMARDIIRDLLNKDKIKTTPNRKFVKYDE